MSKDKKKRLSIFLTRELEEAFEQYRQQHAYWSDSAIGVHLLSIGLKALKDGLEVDWHKPQKAAVAVHDGQQEA